MARTAAKAHLKTLLYDVVMGARNSVLERPRVRAVLRVLGRPVIQLMLHLNRTPPTIVGEPVLSLPLVYAPAAPPLKTAVLLHAYHVEALPEFAVLLRQLPFPFELVVTTDAEVKREAVLAAFSDWKGGELEVRVTANRGRNVAPLLIACRDVFDRAELVLILHTKVSSHTDELAGWRDFLLRDLIGGPRIAAGVMEVFARLPRLGVLAPRIYPAVRKHMVWGDNYVACRDLAERLGFALYPDSPLDFPAGFMFWARSAALKPLLDLDLAWEDFAPEAGQKDGTIAHAVERMVFHACELAGYRWTRAGVQANPAPKEAFWAAWSPRFLNRALTDCGRTVLTPGRPSKPVSGVESAALLAGPDPKAAFRAACAAELDSFLQHGDRLAFPTSSRPKVSILLVLYNQAELTFECLRSLRLALDAPAEIILVDNASSDRTAELLARVDGAKILRNAENLHFLRGVNLGADLATGTHLLLLNNDTRLAPGSIAAAVERLDAEPDLGAVGGRIVLLDDTLQEAGSIIWSDGSCVGYGRGEDPWAPEHQFRRDVDYCSGAFLMMRRELFEALGRLDEAFAPAYYEETDLCMRIREAGLRISYEPRVQISHFEFGSSESSDAALSLQAAHQEVFRSRHAEVLAARHKPAGTPLLQARMRDDRRRLLIIDDQIPYPQMGAGYPRALDILKAAAASGWFVTFYPLMFPDADYAEAYAVLPPDVEIAAERGVDGLAGFLEARAGYYDAVLVSRPHNMKEFRSAVADARAVIDMAKVVYDAEAIFAMREEARARYYGRTERPRADDLGAELALTSGVGVILAVNHSEAAAFRDAGAADVRVLGHALEPTPTPQGFASRRDLLFVGAMDEDDSPNADSLDFFVREVMPKLDALIGDDWVLRVVGRNGAARVHALASPRVQLLGRVEDLTPLYAASRLFIAPTRYAAGIPMKVQEAAAHGLPAAITPLLAGQLGWADGAEATVGETADAFAAACQRLYQDAELWAAVRAGALKRVAEECAPDAFEAEVAAALDAVAKPQAASSSSSLRMSVTAEATPPSSRMTLLQ